MAGRRARAPFLASRRPDPPEEGPRPERQLRSATLFWGGDYANIGPTLSAVWAGEKGGGWCPDMPLCPQEGWEPAGLQSLGGEGGGAPGERTPWQGGGAPSPNLTRGRLPAAAAGLSPALPSPGVAGLGGGCTDDFRVLPGPGLSRAWSSAGSPVSCSERSPRGSRCWEPGVGRLEGGAGGSVCWENGLLPLPGQKPSDRPGLWTSRNAVSVGCGIWLLFFPDLGPS